MTKEKPTVFPEEKVFEDQGKKLILFNDDVNSFDFVIKSLVQVCDHTFEQAETCAWIAHFKGKCAVKSGTVEELQSYKTELINRQLTVSIE